MRLFKILSVFLAVGLLTACAARGTIESRKADNITQPKSLYIRAALGDTIKVPETLLGSAHDEADIFGTQMVDTLRQCGVKASFFKVDPLAIDNSAETKAENGFAHDATLRIGAINELVGNGFATATYELELADAKKKTMWKAEVKLHWTRMVSMGETLASTILTRLQQDGLINASCTVSKPVQPQ